MAIAVQNIVWGLCQPLTGYLADKHGAGTMVAPGETLERGLSGRRDLCMSSGGLLERGIRGPWSLEGDALLELIIMMGFLLESMI
jgi:hypothetical protein